MISPKRVLVNFGVLLISLLVMMGILEFLLAIVQINQKSNIYLIPGKGTTYIPSAYYRHTKEGFSEGYFNSHGFRDYERTYEKLEGTFRIMVFGDSYVEALQVALKNSFPALLQKQLNNTSASVRFEVLALGQSGFGTADEYMRYLNFGKLYNPDLVILSFYSGNDVQNNSKILNREALAFYFVFDKNGNLVLDRSLFENYENSMTFPQQLYQRIKRHSYLASLVSERLFLLRRQNWNSYFKAQMSGDLQEERKLGEFSHMNIYLPELRERWKEAFDISKGLILKFKEEVEKDGAKFVLVTLSNAPQIRADIQHRLNEEFSLTLDYEQPDRILEEFAKQNGVILLQLMPIFREKYLRTGKDLHGFSPSGMGHWNESGHYLAAEEIFKFLKKTELVPP